jgi:hypothetical protein
MLEGSGWVFYSVDRDTVLVCRTSEEFRAMLRPPRLASIPFVLVE